MLVVSSLAKVADMMPMSRKRYGHLTERATREGYRAPRPGLERPRRGMKRERTYDASRHPNPTRV